MRPDSRSSLEPGAGRSYIVVGVLGLILVSSITISAYVYGYLTTYVQSTLRMSSHVAFAMTMISGLASTCVLPIGGWYSDKIGRKPVMITFTLLLAACTLPAFLAIIHFRTPGALYAATALLNVFRAIGFAPMLTAITESLPRRVRAGVFGTLYALAVMLLGGSTQFVVAWLTGVSGNPLVPAWFITGAAILGLSAMIALRESAPAVVERVRRRITVPT